MGGVELTPAGSTGMEGRRKTPARSRTSAIRAAKLASSAWMESACRTCSMPMATAFRRTATVTTPTRPSDRRRSESARTTVESAASFAPTEFGTPAMRRLRASARSDRSRGWFHACDAVSASSRASTGRGRSRVSAPGWEPARRAKRITARSPAASAAKERRCRSGPVVRTARGEAGCRWARARPTRSARRARRIRRPARARAGVEGRSPARGPAIRAPAAGTRGAPGADARPVADCRYGHGGTGENGDSCAGVPAETWRCVYSSRLGGYVSQFCRNGKWTNFNFNPRNCSACRCSFSLSCCQAGYTGSGCS